MKAMPASGFRRTAATIPGVGSEACKSATRIDSIEVNSTAVSRPMSPDRVTAARGAKLLAMVCSIGSCVRLMRCEEKSNGRTPSGSGFSKRADTSSSEIELAPAGASAVAITAPRSW